MICGFRSLQEIRKSGKKRRKCNQKSDPEIPVTWPLEKKAKKSKPKSKKKQTKKQKKTVHENRFVYWPKKHKKKAKNKQKNSKQHDNRFIPMWFAFFCILHYILQYLGDYPLKMLFFPHFSLHFFRFFVCIHCFCFFVYIALGGRFFHRFFFFFVFAFPIPFLEPAKDRDHKS